MTKIITVFFIRGPIQIFSLIRKYIMSLKYNLINVSIRKSCFKKIVSFSSNFETKVRYILSFGVFVMIRTRCNVAKNVFEITNCILSNLPYECNPWHFWTEGKFAQQPWGHGTQPGTHWVVPCPIPKTYQIHPNTFERIHVLKCLPKSLPISNWTVSSCWLDITEKWTLIFYYCNQFQMFHHNNNDCSVNKNTKITKITLHFCYCSMSHLVGANRQNGSNHENWSFSHKSTEPRN